MNKILLVLCAFIVLSAIAKAAKSSTLKLTKGELLAAALLDDEGEDEDDGDELFHADGRPKKIGRKVVKRQEQLKSSRYAHLYHQKGRDERFIKALIKEHAKTKQELVEELELWGMRDFGPHYVVVLDELEREIFAADTGDIDIETEMAEAYASRLEERLKQLIDDSMRKDAYHPAIRKRFFCLLPELLSIIPQAIMGKPLVAIEELLEMTHGALQDVLKEKEQGPEWELEYEYYRQTSQAFKGIIETRKAERELLQRTRVTVEQIAAFMKSSLSE